MVDVGGQCIVASNGLERVMIIWHATWSGPYSTVMVIPGRTVKRSTSEGP